MSKSKTSTELIQEIVHEIMDFYDQSNDVQALGEAFLVLLRQRNDLSRNKWSQLGDGSKNLEKYDLDFLVNQETAAYNRLILRILKS